MSGADLSRVLLVVVAWGLNFVAVRIGLDGLPPLFLCVLRFALSALPAVFFIARPQVPWRLLTAYGAIMFALQFGLVFSGMKIGVSPGLASLIIQTQAFFTIGLAAWLFRERPSPWKLLGAAISFSGILYVASHSHGQLSLLGLTLILMAAFSWAIGNLLSKKLGKLASLSLVIWGSLMALPFMLVFSIVLEGPALIISSLQNISFTSILAVLYIVYFSSYLGYSLWTDLLSRHPVATIAPFSLLVPVVGFLGSAIFLGESLPNWKMIGSLLVITGLAFNVFEARVRAGWRARFQKSAPKKSALLGVDILK